MSLPLAEAKSFMQRTLSKTKYAAKTTRGLDFDIDIDHIMDLYKAQQGLCALTGWELQFTRGGEWDGKNPYGATMDRKDNSQGYVKGNIQLTCGIVNVVRGKLSLPEFKKLCCDVAVNG